MSSDDSYSVSFRKQFESLSENIIAEVQKRPALYDISLVQYSDRNIKSKLWEEVYESVVFNWINLSEDEQKKKSKTIQKKWKNMRDSFAKELARQRSKSGEGSVKKKKYIHFDALLFLVPSLQRRAKNMTSLYADIDISKNLPKDSNRPARKKAPQRQEDYKDQLLDLLNTKQNMCNYDEDINFSQMIVPMLRKLNDEQKHFAKIEIMNILEKAKHFHSLEDNEESDVPSPEVYTYAYSPSLSPTVQLQTPNSPPVKPVTPSVTDEPQIISRKITSKQLPKRPSQKTIHLLKQ